MYAELLQSFLVVLMLVGAGLFVRSLTGTRAGTQPAYTARPARVRPAPETAGLLPMMPPPVPAAEVTPSPLPLAQGPERRRRRLSLAEARRGIVHAAILGPCRADRADEPW